MKRFFSILLISLFLPASAYRCIPIHPASIVFDCHFPFPFLVTILIEKHGFQPDYLDSAHILNAVPVFL